ncbi:FkbM family methyltransferase [Algoriphagus halophilus]|uniref:Methyltransferase, FkbM family n=1 Tax=Algoriphagus halophilus TaxID=226505 RepID=A0A1N6ECL8_9BACT|nr:FkbM family methyltransferase [Algoriphagus halophilus]SIN80770.1 methyltransferase, FkbM family [Algoriphagus halophilus]
MKKALFKYIKLHIVNLFHFWFYDVKRLPVGTHFFYFLKYRVQFDIKTVFDVGANVGGFTNQILKIYSKSENHCFEPIKGTFEILKRNLGTNSNVILNQIAIGDLVQNLSIRINEPNRADINSLVLENQPKNSLLIEDIEVNTLDNYIESCNIKSVDLLKIDTEGYDLNVLKGSNKNLSLGIFKLIYVECGLDKSNTRHVHLSSFIEYLSNYDYIFVGLFQTDIRKIDRKIHFSNALFIHNSFSTLIKTFL